MFSTPKCPWWSFWPQNLSSAVALDSFICLKTRCTKVSNIMIKRTVRFGMLKTMKTTVKQLFYGIHHTLRILNNCFPCWRSLYKVHQSLIEETLLWSPIQVLVRDSDWSSRIPHFVIWGYFASIIWYSFFWWYIICWALLFLCQIIFKSPQAYCPTKKGYSKTFCSKPSLHQNAQYL